MIQVTITGNTDSIEGLLIALGSVSLWLHSLNSSDFNRSQLDNGVMDSRHISAGKSELNVVLEKQIKHKPESDEDKYVVCWKSADGSDDAGSGKIVLSLTDARHVVSGMAQTCPHLKVWIDDVHLHPDAVPIAPPPPH